MFGRLSFLVYRSLEICFSDLEFQLVFLNLIDNRIMLFYAWDFSKDSFKNQTSWFRNSSCYVTCGCQEETNYLKQSWTCKILFVPGFQEETKHVKQYFGQSDACACESWIMIFFAAVKKTYALEIHLWHLCAMAFVLDIIVQDKNRYV